MLKINFILKLLGGEKKISVYLSAGFACKAKLSMILLLPIDPKRVKSGRIAVSH